MNPEVRVDESTRSVAVSASGTYPSHFQICDDEVLEPTLTAAFTPSSAGRYTVKATVHDINDHRAKKDVALAVEIE